MKLQNSTSEISKLHASHLVSKSERGKKEAIKLKFLRTFCWSVAASERRGRIIVTSDFQSASFQTLDQSS